ncbi:MAG: tRNA (N6-isopentenyl adenosine(37)-C2)-methylthiotransferase MiaB [Treponema sp.]|nr:tRNA (N6-isopentenyl adenosine(37)-C2)-methylthiotransferase MiaB [Treponema sp.]
MKYFFESYGCQMNKAESAALILAAKEQGWEEGGPDSADLILLNTCSVRATAEQRVYGRLAHYTSFKKKRSPFTLVVTGCMAERLGEKLRKEFPGLDYIMGTSARAQFPDILKAIEQGVSFSVGEEKPEFAFSGLHFDSENPFRAFIPIMNGCNNYCSYCIVPYLRGPEVSRSPEAIIEEIRAIDGMGVKEITLLGQNVNSYRWNELDFPGLLELIAKNLEDLENIKWVRFLSSHPKDFSDKTIEVIAKNPCFCRHIHLCVQHGSNNMLKAMNRRYTAEQYLELINRLRFALPDLSLSTDILVGFPGETEEDLQQTLDLMEKIKFLYAYMYHFNPREGTAAFDLPGRISEEIKRERLSKVIDLQKRHTREILKGRVGEKAVVLIEGISKKSEDELIARTERDEMVVVKGSKNEIGSFKTVTLTSLRGNTFRAAD